MALPADYHMHTPLCRHAVGEPTEYAAHAIKMGLKEIGMSDHNPMIRDDFDDWHMRIDQLDEYVEKVEKARRDHPNLTIKLSLETDYLPGHEDWIRDLAARHPWDYLIGSVHYVSDSWDLDNPRKLSEWKKRDPFEVWTVYFERLTQAAASGLFEIIGHADLVQKVLFLPATGLHAALRAVPPDREEESSRHRNQHRRTAQRLQRNVSQQTNPPNGFANRRRADFWFGCARAGRSGDEFHRRSPTRPRRWLHALLPLHTATV